MEVCSEEAVKLVWEGSIPLQIHLHESEITTLPPPPPALVLSRRIGYLPLLIPLLKPHFSSTLPLGTDTVWFDYKGLPLKWYIPTGVLFDLLCAEPERPWNLTDTSKNPYAVVHTHAEVHFRGYPGDILTPCDGEDNVKWSFINSLKEAAYIINGNCKNVMNMSQADQLELWQSLVKGNMDGYTRVSSRLKLGPFGEDFTPFQNRQVAGEMDSAVSNRPCRIPVRLYIRHIYEDVDDLEDATPVESWDRISYINRPVEVRKEEGNITLKSAMKFLLPEFFGRNSVFQMEGASDEADLSFGYSDAARTPRNNPVEETPGTYQAEDHKNDKIKLIRIQGIELDQNIPFYWVINNLKNPEYFLHICVFVSMQQTGTR